MGIVFQAWALASQHAAALTAEPGRLDELLSGGAAGHGVPTVDLEKSWHGVHFLLTGTPWDRDTPLGMAVLGGRPVGEDKAYGPPRLLGPETVRDVAAALAALDPEELRRGYDPLDLQLAEIYPEGAWSQDDIDGYLLPHLRSLTAFYQAAAASGAAVLISLS